MSLLAQPIARREELSVLLPPAIAEDGAGESAVALGVRMGQWMENAGNLIASDPGACGWGLLTIAGEYLEPFRNQETGTHVHDVFVALQIAWNTAWRIGSPLWQAVVEMVRFAVWESVGLPVHELQTAANGDPLVRAHPSVDPPLRSI